MESHLASCPPDNKKVCIICSQGRGIMGCLPFVVAGFNNTISYKKVLNRKNVQNV